MSIVFFCKHKKIIILTQLHIKLQGKLLSDLEKRKIITHNIIIKSNTHLIIMLYLLIIRPIFGGKVVVGVMEGIVYNCGVDCVGATRELKMVEVSLLLLLMTEPEDVT